MHFATFWIEYLLIHEGYNYWCYNALLFFIMKGFHLKSISFSAICHPWQLSENAK
ncbi:MAG: hypothetical protein JWR54_3279 [Mucilaginibacter sp.]|nr:hypothetical protein [Mucilaginibacter sp.]